MGKSHWIARLAIQQHFPIKILLVFLRFKLPPNFIFQWYRPQTCQFYLLFPALSISAFHKVPGIHLIGISDLVDLWVIKIKSLLSFAHAVRRDHVNRARNADHVATTCEWFAYFIVKITRLYDYQTWQTHFWRNARRGAQTYMGFGC